MPCDEYEDWLAFYDLEPFGDSRSNVHAGMIAAVLANQSRQKGSRAYTFKDFMIMTPDEKRDKETREFASFVQAVAVKRG